MYDAPSNPKAEVPVDGFGNQAYAEIYEDGGAYHASSDIDFDSENAESRSAGSSEISELANYDEIYVESEESLESILYAAESFSEDDESAASVAGELTASSHENKFTGGLKSAAISFKNALLGLNSNKTKYPCDSDEATKNPVSLIPRLKSKKGEKAENNLEDKNKTDISEQFKDYLAILTNLIKPENTESKERVFHHADYPDIPELKPGLLPESLEVLEYYWLYPPHSYAVIVNDEEKNKQYLIFEPKISEKEHLILEETDAQLRSIILYDAKAQRDELNLDSDLVYKIIINLDQNIADDRIDIIRYYLQRNFKGYGKLDPLMHDESIEDITCNGPDIPVFIFHRKYSNLPVNIIFDPNELNKFVLKIAQKADKQLSLTAPLVDAALPEGARAQITYTDVVSSKGSSFTIRKFKSEPMTPVDLIDYGTYDAEILAFIWLCVENRKSAIVVGGTASGKTSMMNAFSLFIPHLAKIVSIEDTREIQMPHKNWLPMKTRESASESGKGNVDMFSLLRTALRQRPEYIIVGEVRGSEAQTLFQAMNTGHTTYSTLHAGGVEQAINRLTTNPINVPVAMFGALDLIIIQQLQYMNGRMVRRCITIDEVIAERGDISYNILYKWNPAKDNFRKISKESKIINDIAYSHGWTVNETLKQIERRKKILTGLLEHGIRNSDEITAVFDEFAKSGRYEFEG